jgi:glycosyltransferase involved in cell wall biosynthesis
MKTTLFLPTLNEINAVRQIMPRIKREWVDEILVVDGGSTDGTVEYFKERGFNVIGQKMKGMAGAEWACFDEAKGDVIIMFTPDGNSVPELIPPLIEKMKEGHEMVIVSRYLPPAWSEDDDVVTAFGNWMFTKTVNLLFGGRFTDVLVGYRAITRRLAQELPRIEIPVLEIIMCIRCLKRKWPVAEIPGDEPKRIGGIRKMRPLYNGSCLLWTMFKEFFIRPGPK